MTTFRKAATSLTAMFPLGMFTNRAASLNLKLNFFFKQGRMTLLPTCHSSLKCIACVSLHQLPCAEYTCPYATWCQSQKTCIFETYLESAYNKTIQFVFAWYQVVNLFLTRCFCYSWASVQWIGQWSCFNERSRNMWVYFGQSGNLYLCTPGHHGIKTVLPRWP